MYISTCIFILHFRKSFSGGLAPNPNGNSPHFAPFPPHSSYLAPSFAKCWIRHCARRNWLIFQCRYSHLYELPGVKRLQWYAWFIPYYQFLFHVTHIPFIIFIGSIIKPVVSFQFWTNDQYKSFINHLQVYSNATGHSDTTGTCYIFVVSPVKIKPLHWLSRNFENSTMSATWSIALRNR